MKQAFMVRIITVFIAVMLFVLTITPDGVCYHRNGDVNGDGWCNWADVISFKCYYETEDAPSCFYWGGDCNGDEIVTLSDMIYLINYLNGFGPAPIGVCDNPVVPCDETQQATIWIGDPTYTGNTATLSVYVADATVEIAAFHFSLIYDTNVFTKFSATNIVSDGLMFYNDRTYMTGINIITFSFQLNTPCNASDFSSETKVFEIKVYRAPGTQAGLYELCIADDDPIFGPPRFYGNSPDYAKRCILPSCEIMVAGDANGDGNVIGGDVTYMVNYLRGAGNPPAAKYFRCCIPIRWH